MAQNITLLGASYSNVPAVTLPKTGGGTARFDDTSDANATAADISNGKTAYVNGEKVTGTATVGGIVQDAQGYLVLDDDGSGGEAASTPSMKDPIRFFDYDGTLVASYASVPSALPSVPTHDNLKDGTWNYTLAQITTQFNAMGTCDVGANYMTKSEATEIDIVLQECRLHPYLSLAVNGTVSIDWGDGTTPDTSTGTSLTSRKSDIHHEYAQAGSYTIKITKTSGTGYSLYCSSTYSLLNKNISSQPSANRVYANCVKAVRVGAYCSVGSNAFYNCYSLASVSIPSTVTSIGENAFRGCSSLASIAIPNGVTSTDSSVFHTCCSLTSVSIPSSVTSIGNYAFYYCYSLASLAIPSGVTSSIGNYAFYYCSSLASLAIPSGVTSIGNYAFNGCSSLASLAIPSGVTSIGASAFYGCYSLASVSIPSGVTSIGTSAFYNCYSLASVSIPSGVTSIDNSAFYACYGMAEYHFLRTESVPTLGTTAFYNIQSDCVIYVPASKLNDYKTAENWSTYADYMAGE